jgi:hypothetical protein
MSFDNRVELFLMKCAVAEGELRKRLFQHSPTQPAGIIRQSAEELDRYIKQFDMENRKNATKMSFYYEIFYMLENDIRTLIVQTLKEAYGNAWWSTQVPQHVREEATRNRRREAEAGVSLRSENDIDYITFGQLSDIIKDNWSNFAGMLSNPAAVTRVLSALNMLRGTIAHCGVLAEDEVDRLKLAIRDWFRVLEGPK